MNEKIQQFLASQAFGVVGASTNRQKFGNKVLRCYLQQKLQVYPVNPNQELIEGLPAVPTVADLPNHVKSISVITPPPVTEKIVAEAIAKGIKNIWMQPGAESVAATKLCEQHNINVIAGGPCILVQMGFPDNA